MTIDEIKEIIQLLAESGVAEIEVQRGENRVWIKRATQIVTNDFAVSAQQPMAVSALGNSFSTVATASAPPPSAAMKEEERVETVTSPIVGTFYESASPGAPAFVKAGDAVQPGQVLCIIESMKLMNEIEAEVAGVIVAKLVPNGKPVEYGEPLFSYRPL